MDRKELPGYSKSAATHMFEEDPYKSVQKILKELDASSMERKGTEPADRVQEERGPQENEQGGSDPLEEGTEIEIDQGNKINKAMLADEEVEAEILSAAKILDATSKFAEKKAGRKGMKKAKRAVEPEEAKIAEEAEFVEEAKEAKGTEEAKGAKGVEEPKGADEAKGAEEAKALQEVIEDAKGAEETPDATPLETGDSIDSATLSQLFLMKSRKRPVGRGLHPRTCKN